MQGTEIQGQAQEDLPEPSIALWTTFQSHMGLLISEENRVGRECRDGYNHSATQYEFDVDLDGQTLTNEPGFRHKCPKCCTRSWNERQGLYLCVR